MLSGLLAFVIAGQHQPTVPKEVAIACRNLKLGMASREQVTNQHLCIVFVVCRLRGVAPRVVVDPCGCVHAYLC